MDAPVGTICLSTSLPTFPLAPVIRIITSSCPSVSARDVSAIKPSHRRRIMQLRFCSRRSFRRRRHGGPALRDLAAHPAQKEKLPPSGKKVGMALCIFSHVTSCLRSVPEPQVVRPESSQKHAKPETESASHEVGTQHWPIGEVIHNDSPRSEANLASSPGSHPEPYSRPAKLSRAVFAG